MKIREMIEKLQELENKGIEDVTITVDNIHGFHPMFGEDVVFTESKYEKNVFIHSNELDCGVDKLIDFVSRNDIEDDFFK